jgi:hypothetical protein
VDGLPLYLATCKPDVKHAACEVGVEQPPVEVVEREDAR